MRRWKVVRLEAAELDSLRFGDVERCLDALDARLIVTASYHGAAGERLLDERHAQLVGMVVSVLRALGWETRVEISYSEFGERGSIDVVGWLPARRVLVVTEVKSELGGIEATLRPLDAKCGLAPKVVANRFGWRPVLIARMLVLPEESTARRAVARHSAILDQALPARSRELRQWLRDPASATAGIWFLSSGRHHNAKRNPSAIVRVRSGVRRAKGNSP